MKQRAKRSAPLSGEEARECGSCLNELPTCLTSRFALFMTSRSLYRHLSHPSVNKRSSRFRKGGLPVKIIVLIPVPGPQKRKDVKTPHWQSIRDNFKKIFFSSRFRHHRGSLEEYHFTTGDGIIKHINEKV